VVTEYGVASLYGKTIRERAQQLINVAHPDFREELTKEAQALHYI
jgi:acetyl-CoA hydrolase